MWPLMLLTVAVASCGFGLWLVVDAALSPPPDETDDEVWS
jgi:hypothetical protein